MRVLGLVQDAHTGLPVPGVRLIDSLGGPIGCTDSAGRFAIDVPGWQPLPLLAEHRLYGSREVTVTPLKHCCLIALEVDALPEETVTA